MPNIEKTEKQYEKLRNSLQDIIERNRANLEEITRETVVRTHWEVGKCLCSSLGEDETESSSGIIERLAGDLKLHKTVLYRSSKFYRLYPDGLPSDSGFAALSWSSVTELLPIPDEEERLFYINRAAQENWSRVELRKAIRADGYHGGKKKKKVKKGSNVLSRPSPGLYTYEAELERVARGG